MGLAAVGAAIGSSRLKKAMTNWLDAPINSYGTPYVGYPESFTRAEAKEFLDLVRQPRYVPRDEQMAKLRWIVKRRSMK
jgi:hypothetical protein